MYGFHVARIKFDYMHIVHLGVALHLNGAALVLLQSSGYWGKADVTGALRLAHDQFKIFCKDHKIQ